MPWAEMDAFKNVAVYVSHCQVSWNTQAIFPRQIATWLWPLELRGPQSWIVTVMILPFSSRFWVLINIQSSFSWTMHSSTCLKHTANVLSSLACRFACYLVPPLLSILTAAALRRQEDRMKVSPSPRVAASYMHQTQCAGELWGGKNSNIYALLVTNNQVTILPRPVREKLGLGSEWDKWGICLRGILKEASQTQNSIIFHCNVS